LDYAYNSICNTDGNTNVEVGSIGATAVNWGDDRAQNPESSFDAPSETICVVIVLIVGVFFLMYRGPERTGPVFDRATYGDHRKNTSEPPTQR